MPIVRVDIVSFVEPSPPCPTPQPYIVDLMESHYPGLHDRLEERCCTDCIICQHISLLSTSPPPRYYLTIYTRTQFHSKTATITTYTPATAIMQLTSLLTALLGVSTTALALPTADTTEAPTTYTTDESLFNNTIPLEKRAHHGWLSSYAPNDKECKGGWGGDRPKVEGNGCITFKPVSHNIGIYHGSVSSSSFLPLSPLGG